MPANNAQLTVNFTSQTLGDHRVCWRIQGVGAYDCTTIINCPVGVTCDAMIGLYVNPEECEDTVIEGYVQPLCNDVISLTGRIPFTATLVANPTCISYQVTCNSVELERIDVISPGINYTAGATLALTVDGSATAECTVGLGEIYDYNILTAGTLYLPGDVVNVIDSGAGAGATIQVLTVGGSGEILTLDLIAVGTAYSGPSVSSITSASGVGATISLSTDYGIISGTNVLIPGSGYNSVPSVSITTPGSGLGAQFLAVLKTCSDFIGTYCDGTLDNKIPSPPLGVATTFCLQAAPTVFETYSVDQAGCCSADCWTYTFEHNSSTDGPVDFKWTECGGLQNVVTLNNGENLEVCAVDGSPYIVDSPSILEPLNVTISIDTPCTI